MINSTSSHVGIQKLVSSLQVLITLLKRRIGQCMARRKKALIRPRHAYGGISRPKVAADKIVTSINRQPCPSSSL